MNNVSWRERPQGAASAGGRRFGGRPEKTARVFRAKPFKALSFGKNYKKAGRNFSGRITIFHRGGGAKRLLRRIDFQREANATGIVERIEYDPNRTARIALVRWCDFEFDSWIGRVQRSDTHPKILRYKLPFSQMEQEAMLNISLDFRKTERKVSLSTAFLDGFDVRTQKPSKIDARPLRALRDALRPKRAASRIGHTPNFHLYKNNEKQILSRNVYSYILACNQLKAGDKIVSIAEPHSIEPLVNKAAASDVLESRSDHSTQSTQQFYLKNGNCFPLWMAPLGSVIHNIANAPGKGGRFGRAAGACAQLVQKIEKKNMCIIRLPSGQQQLFDLRCRATIGIVSNIDHNTYKLTKAGQTRWKGRRPIVRGVAMNPVDHPHGGGEGRTKGGRPSVSPWGKPAKGPKQRKAKKIRKI